MADYIDLPAGVGAARKGDACDCCNPILEPPPYPAMPWEPTRHDRYFFAQAVLAQGMSTCPRYGGVGAVLVHAGVSFLSARSGMAPGEPHCSHGSQEVCTGAMHAEQNLIAYAAREQMTTKGGTVYLTLSPCYPCAGLMLSAGITDVRFLRKYRLTDGIERLWDRGVSVTQFDL